MPTLSDIWTKEQIKQFVKWRAEGLSASEIGRRLGKTANAVRNKLNRLKMFSESPRRKPLYIRKCLNCRKVFKTRWKTIRICRWCKATEEWRGYDFA